MDVGVLMFHVGAHDGYVHLATRNYGCLSGEIRNLLLKIRTDRENQITSRGV